MVKSEELRALIALLRLPGIKDAQLMTLLDQKELELSSLFAANGQCKLTRDPVHWHVVEKDLEWSTFPNCHIISRRDAAYPSLLKEIANPPPVLFLKGNLASLSKPQIAMVGSRHPTVEGCKTAIRFARHFAAMGLTITSGLALGIDRAAHQGALMGSGNTVAVLGHGLDSVYPKTNSELALEIVEKGGALVSEFPIGTPPASPHFPRRNRIISGLTLGTLVVEAAMKSGSLITARLAGEQGREIFAIPGSIHNPLVKGCHALIQQGAKLVETAEDVLEELRALIKYVSCEGQ